MAVSAALVQARAVRLVLEQPGSVTRPARFLESVASSSASLAASLLAGLAPVEALLERGASPREAARTLGTSTLAIESVPAALWAFLAAHESCSSAVVTAATLGGDVDTLCALVGALAGALHGASGIPGDWLANLEGETPSVDDILRLADRHGMTRVA